MHNTPLQARFDSMHFRAVVFGHEVDHGSKEGYLARPRLNHLDIFRGACATICYPVRYNLTVLVALFILMPVASDVEALLLFRLVCYLLALATSAFAVLEARRTKRKTMKEENMTLYAAGG